MFVFCKLPMPSATLCAFAFRLRHVGIRVTRFNRFHTSPSVNHLADGKTVDNDELAKFDSAAGEWWNSPLSDALHSMNTVRVPLICNALASSVRDNKGNLIDVNRTPYPLSGLTLLDVGCGGGILSEPLARLGAKVTGIDASAKLIETATLHASHDPDIRERVTYINSSIEEFCDDNTLGSFDGVVASEIIEHVSDQKAFLNSCCRLVRPGGSFFLTTVNRTPLSFALAIAAAEYVIGVLPRGTHDWNKFISPEEVEQLLLPNQFTVRLVNGVAFNPFTMNWCLTSSTQVNYMLHAINMSVVDSPSSSDT